MCSQPRTVSPCGFLFDFLITIESCSPLNPSIQFQHPSSSNHCGEEVFNEIHPSIRIPNELSEKQSDALRRILLGEALMSRLRLAVRGVIRASPQLAIVRVTLSR
jgi:hypothetical protein